VIHQETIRELFALRGERGWARRVQSATLRRCRGGADAKAVELRFEATVAVILVHTLLARLTVRIPVFVVLVRNGREEVLYLLLGLISTSFPEQGFHSTFALLPQ